MFSTQCITIRFRTPANESNTPRPRRPHTHFRTRKVFVALPFDSISSACCLDASGIYHVLSEISKSGPDIFARAERARAPSSLSARETFRSMANELALLDRVLARFSMATTDEAFTASIATLLVPTLDVLRSEHAESRNKVITVLSHVNKRVKANAAIKLPLMALLSQYKNTASNAFLRNFNIIYIEMAFERTTQDERLEALPLILCDISKWSITHQARFFHLVLGQVSDFVTKPYSTDAFLD
jgi:hypothetical protein